MLVGPTRYFSSGERISVLLAINVDNIELCCNGVVFPIDLTQELAQAR
jgi:hypothetical protein